MIGPWPMGGVHMQEEEIRQDQIMGGGKFGEEYTLHPISAS